MASHLSQTLARKLQSVGQSHVLKFLDQISESEARLLLSQVENLDFDLIKTAHAFATQTPLEDDIQPLLDSTVFIPPKHSVMEFNFRNRGLLSIASGKVCAILLAGGQGTRLGFSGPKGAFDAGFNSRKSLFELSIDRLKKVKSMAAALVGLPDAPLPLYILTSEGNDVETREFFERHHFFGLNRSDIFFFTQGMLPCLTLDGKLMLESKFELAMSPDGNGGVFSALEKSGALVDMQRRGVEYCHVMAIDNPQNLPGDPLFLGCCISQQVEAGNLCVAKKHADERVGVCGLRNGKFHVVEYTECHGRHVSSLANICNHFFTVQFLLQKVLPGMKAIHHAAHKQIPTYEDPAAKGIKLELFIFDAFPFADKYLAMQANRSETFAPIKNATGDDSPQTCRNLVSELHRSWLVAAGAILEGEPTASVEISSLVTVNGEGLDRLVSGLYLQCPLLLTSEEAVHLDEFGLPLPYRVQVDFASSPTRGCTHYRVVLKRSED